MLFNVGEHWHVSARHVMELLIVRAEGSREMIEHHVLGHIRIFCVSAYSSELIEVLCQFNHAAGLIALSRISTAFSHLLVSRKDASGKLSPDCLIIRILLLRQLKIGDVARLLRVNSAITKSLSEVNCVICNVGSRAFPNSVVKSLGKIQEPRLLCFAVIPIDRSQHIPCPDLLPHQARMGTGKPFLIRNVSAEAEKSFHKRQNSLVCRLLVVKHQSIKQHHMGEHVGDHLSVYFLKFLQIGRTEPTVLLDRRKERFKISLRCFQMLLVLSQYRHRIKASQPIRDLLPALRNVGIQISVSLLSKIRTVFRQSSRNALAHQLKLSAEPAPIKRDVSKGKLFHGV